MAEPSDLEAAADVVARLRQCYQSIQKQIGHVLKRHQGGFGVRQLISGRVFAKDEPHRVRALLKTRGIHPALNARIRV